MLSESQTIARAEEDLRAARERADRVRDAAAVVQEAEQGVREAELRLQRARELPEQRKAREQAEAERRERQEERGRCIKRAESFDDASSRKFLKRIAAAEQEMRDAIVDFVRQCESRNDAVRKARALAEQDGEPPPELSELAPHNMRLMVARAVREQRTNDVSRTVPRSIARELCQGGAAAWIDLPPSAR